MSALRTGVFTLSLDFELIWGTQDLFGPESFRKACQVEREVVIDRLLSLLARHEIPATWCVVGHLFLDRCESNNGVKHPEIVRPRHSWVRGDWFQHDPGGTEEAAPLFLGRSLIAKIRNCAVPQEIGCHSFSHVIFGDTGCSRQAAASEVGACVALAREMDVELRAFAFPRNRVGHVDVLEDAGFLCYRGPGPKWYERDDSPGALGRLAHLVDLLIAASPPTVLPERTAAGLWNIPGSMIYLPMHGPRRLIPVSRRVRRALKGLRAAVERKRVFHLWFHPTNLADETELMFRGLDLILGEAARLRAQGQIRILTMPEITAAAAG